MRGVRFYELDVLRGSAVIAMVVFHAFYDLDFLGYVSIDLSSGFWWFFPRAIASVFIFVAGVSLALSYSGGRIRISHYIIRGAELLGVGLVITCVTYVFVPYAYIRFGILHFIGLATLLSFPFLRCDKRITVSAGVLTAVAGLMMRDVRVSFPYLFWLGLKPRHFYTLDYFPLLPWFSLILFGIVAGNILYPDHSRRWSMREVRDPGVISWLGRHSLLIYLLHQPVLLFFISLAGKMI